MKVPLVPVDDNAMTGEQPTYRDLWQRVRDELPRRSLAARILAWLFGRRERVRPGWFCCDRCNPEWAKRLVTE